MKEKGKKVTLAVTAKSFFKQIKKLFLWWIILAIIVGILASIITIVTSKDKGTVSAVINFSFDGIEQGLDPAGNKFDVYELKNSDNIKKALDNLGFDSSDETVQELKNNISVDGVVPSNIISEITNYDSIVGSDGVNSYTSINDTSYNPTQFDVSLRYINTDISKSDASKLLNELLDVYNEYFYDTYGYNKAIEESITSIEYENYDYNEAIDIIDSSLNSLKVYVDSLANNDNTRFVSTETGFSFSDLSKAVDTLRSENVGWISSYITSNNITKDKAELINYYEFKIDDSTRLKQSYAEQLDTVEDAIENYEKTNTVVLGVGNDEEEYSYSQSSDTYDNLVNQRVTLQTNISNTEEQIKLYKKRVSELKSSKGSTGSVEATEEYFDDLISRIDTIIENVNKTATEYYKDVALKNAYQVVTYSDGSALSFVRIILSHKKEVLSYELVLFAIYLLASIIFSISETNGKELNIKFGGKDKK